MILRKRYLFLLLVLALILVACQPMTAPVSAADEECDVAGAYVGTFTGGPWDDPLYFHSKLIPLDPMGNRLSYTVQLINPDESFRIPPFSEADRMTDLYGEAVKTDPGTYDISLMNYAVNNREGDRDEVLYMWTVVGTMKCEGDTITDSVIFGVYAADQDADKDGIPDEGAETIFCHEGSLFNATRQPMLKPCDLPPAEEDTETATDLDIVGKWVAEGLDFGFYHQFNEDGSLIGSISSDTAEETQLFTAEYWFEDGQLYMSEVDVVEPPPCGPEPAIYDAELLENGNLKLTMITDTCEARIGVTSREHAPAE